MIIKYKSIGCEGKQIKFKFVDSKGDEVFKALPYYNYTLKQVNANVSYINKLKIQFLTLSTVFLVDNIGNIVRTYHKKDCKYIQKHKL